MPELLPWVFDDGGRASSGFKGLADGDCVCRSIAIVTKTRYREVYDDLIRFCKTERVPKGDTRSHPRTGVAMPTIKKYMGELGWVWIPAMGIGTGTQIHLNQDELPVGRLMLRLSKHVTAVVDDEIRDIFDPSREGTRCVYGFWAEGSSNEGLSQLRK